MQYSARELFKHSNYKGWKNFENLIKRVINMIENDFKDGIIVKTKSYVSIGSGAKRKVDDYILNDDAVNIVKEMDASFKLNGVHLLRNERIILSLLKKYCEIKRITFDYQYKVGCYIYDCKVENILIEFDDPYHSYKKEQIEIDKFKDELAEKNGYKILRFRLVHDIIDIICCVEHNLST